MTITGDVAVAVIDLDHMPEILHFTGKSDDAATGGQYRRAETVGNIHAVMSRAFAGKGIGAQAVI